ncbi:separin [Physcia stellaris]|nr:separin [Physcia stellaris]
MTRNVLPLAAANIQDAVSKGTYSVATVRSLEQILHSGHERAPVVTKQQLSVRCPQTQATTTRSAKATGNGRRKQAPVAVLEDGANDMLLSPREKFKLATDVVNNSLRVLTSTVQSSLKPQAKLGGTLSSTPSVQASFGDSGTELDLPLRSLCINQVTDTVQRKCRSPRSSMVSSKENQSSLLAVAKSGSVAFAILRSADVLKISGVQMPYLQLEQGMSILTGKLIALGLYEPAIEELRSLKIRLDAPASTLTQEKRGPRRNLSTKISLGSGKETLPDLLKFQNTEVNEQLLSLIVTFQFHVLRIIAARGRFNDLEAATKHLDLDCPFSPAKFIEKLTEQRSPQASIKAGQQMESLSRLLFSFVLPSRCKNNNREQRIACANR